MDIKSKGAAIELLYSAIPYSNQIKNIDMDSKPDEIYFNWRGAVYKFAYKYGRISLIKDGCEIGDDCSIALTQCVKLAYTQHNLS